MDYKRYRSVRGVLKLHACPPTSGKKQRLTSPVLLSFGGHSDGTATPRKFNQSYNFSDGGKNITDKSLTDQRLTV